MASFIFPNAFAKDKMDAFGVFRLLHTLLSHFKAPNLSALFLRTRETEPSACGAAEGVSDDVSSALLLLFSQLSLWAFESA